MNGLMAYINSAAYKFIGLERRQVAYFDLLLRILPPFSTFLVISGRLEWESDNEKLCALDPCLRLARLPSAQIDPRTTKSGSRLFTSISASKRPFVTQTSQNNRNYLMLSKSCTMYVCYLCNIYRIHVTSEMMGVFYI